MPRDTTVIAFRQPEAINDPLTEVAREGARRMLAQVLIVEADSFVAVWKDFKLPDGRDRKDYAMEAARFLKSKNPHSMVEVKYLQSGDVTAVAHRPE